MGGDRSRRPQAAGSNWLYSKGGGELDAQENAGRSLRPPQALCQEASAVPRGAQGAERSWASAAVAPAPAQGTLGERTAALLRAEAWYLGWHRRSFANPITAGRKAAGVELVWGQARATLTTAAPEPGAPARSPPHVAGEPSGGRGKLHSEPE